MKTTLERIPTWALCYLINGDSTGLESNEIETIREWIYDNKILDVLPPKSDDEGYFTHYPAFGLACDVVECECVLKW